MRCRTIVVGVSAALLTAGLWAGPAPRPTSAAVPNATVATAQQAGLRLEARLPSAASVTGGPVLIDARVTNTGAGTLEYWLPTPCHVAFSVSVQSPSGAMIGPLPREAEAGQEPRPCIQVLRRLILGPGDSVSERFVWMSAGASPGTYLVRVSFSPFPHGDAPTAEVTLPIVLGAEAPPFADVKGHWAGESIAHAVRRGIVRGYPEGDFRPNGQVTRAEFIKMLVIAHGSAPRPSSPLPFADVASHWVYVQGYLSAAVAAGLIHPADFGPALRPDTPIDRQEAALMAVRALGREQAAIMSAGAPLGFSDGAQVAPWARGYIAIASAADLVRGYDDGTFRPARRVTRAEAVTLVLRIDPPR